MRYYGAGTLGDDVPAWVTVLELAGEWGVMPQTVAAMTGDDRKWFWRALEWRRAQVKRAKAQHGAQ